LSHSQFKEEEEKKGKFGQKGDLSDKFNVVYFLCLLAGYPRRVVIR
jgi:hypothetical protein